MLIMQKTILILVLQVRKGFVNNAMHDTVKMAKHTLKILQCSYRKIFKIWLAIFQHYV